VEERRRLGDILNAHGLALLQQNRAKDAEKSYQRSVEEYRLVVRTNRRPSDVSELAGKLNNLALADISLGNNQNARDLIDEAISLQQEALRAEPANSQFQDYLENHHTVLSQLNEMNSAPEN